MKFGDQLAEWSIPEWRDFNLDYNAVKQVIKECTSSKAPPDARNRVFKALLEQYESVNLFVESKAGEIDWRIRNCLSKLDKVAKEDASFASSGRRMGPKRSRKRERSLYWLEEEVAQVTDDVNCLARYINAQRTGFRKLLKKYYRWSNKTDVAQKFLPIIRGQKSFVHKDLTPYFLELSALYNGLRGSTVQSVYPTSPSRDLDSTDAKFDCNFICGGARGRAVFWAPLDSIVELQVWLLHVMSAYSPEDSSPLNIVFFDDKKKLYSVESGLNPCQLLWKTPKDDTALSHVGQTDQAVPEKAVLTAPVGGIRQYAVAQLTSGQAKEIVSDKPTVPPDLPNIAQLAVGWLSKRKVTPLSKATMLRTRFQSLDGANEDDHDPKKEPEFGSWATLDRDILMEKVDSPSQVWDSTVPPTDLQTEDINNDTPQEISSRSNQRGIMFPYAILEIKWSDVEPPWLKDLTETCLVRRMDPTFSIFLHSVALFYSESLVQSPQWMKYIGSKNLFRTPSVKPRLKRLRSNRILHTRTSQNSLTRDSSTATLSSLAPGNNSDQTLETQPQTPISQSPSVARPEVRYWNEFDYPEDDESGFYTDNDQKAWYSASPADKMDNFAAVLAHKMSKAANKVEEFFGIKDDSSATIPRRARDQGYYGSWSDEDSDEERAPGRYANGSDESLSQAEIDDRQHRKGSATRARYDVEPRPRESSALLYRDSKELDSDTALSFIYFTCVMIGFVIEGALAGVASGSGYRLDPGATVITIIGLLFAILLGISGLFLFTLRRRRASWWHQSLMFMFSFIDFCAGLICLSVILIN